MLCDYMYVPSCLGNENTRFDVAVTDIGCSGGGSITLSNFTSPDLYCVEANGGGASYSWTGPAGFTSNSRSISGLAAGTYTVEVADFYGCISRWTGDVNNLPPLVIDCSTVPTQPTVVGGSDGMADVIITSGTGDYSIDWTGPRGGSINNATDGPNTLTGLRAGTYSVTVTDDESGCSEICTIEVTEPPCAIDFTVMLDADRNAVVTVLGGIPDFNIAYVGPTSSPPFGPFGNEGIVIPAADLQPGDYEFVLIEANRFPCQISFFLTIDPIDCSDLQFSVVDIQPPACGGTDDGRIEIFFDGNFAPDIVWSGPFVNGSNSSVLTDLGPGTYSFVITDSRGCTRDSTFTFMTPPELTLACGAVDETLPTLDDGKIGYSVTGGAGPFSLAYSATDPAGNALPGGGPRPIAIRDTLRDLAAGTYLVTVTDANGCTAECSSVVSEPSCSLAPTCMVINPVSAGGAGSVALSFDGAPSWNVTITGPRDTSFVTANPMLTIDNLPQGDYNLSVSSSAGCIGSCMFSVVGPMCALSFTGATGTPSCVGAADGTLTLSVTNAAAGLMVDWSNDAFDGMTTLTGLPAGTYSVTVSDQTGCPVAPQSFTLTNPAPLTVDLSLAQPILCNGDSSVSIMATVTNGAGVLSYDWSVDTLPDANLVTGLVAGRYHVLVTDANGCTGRDTLIVDQPTPLSLVCMTTGETSAGANDGTITISNTGGAAGAGGVVRLSGPLGTTLLTAGTDTTFTGRSPGTYQLAITDANGCTAACTAIVSQGGCNVTVSVLPTQPDCDNLLGSLTANVANANGPTTYLWSNGETTRTINDVAEGTYSVTVTDNLGCDALASGTINSFTDFPGVDNVTLSTVCDAGCSDLAFTLTGAAPFALRLELERNGNNLGVQTINVAAAGDGSYEICPTDFGIPDLNGLTVTILDVTDGNGCGRNSGIELSSSVFPPASSTLDSTICANASLNYFGELFDAARPTGDVVLPTPSANGCDSTVTVNLSFFAPATGALDTMICAGTELDYFGERFNVARPTGDVTVPTPSANGCDSIVTVNLSFFTPATGTLDTMICTGTELNYFGERFNAARTTGDVVVPTPSANGCDSTVTVNLSFFAPATGTLDTMICAGTELDYFGERFNAARPTGDVTVPTPSANGCDSTVTVNLSFFAPATGTLDTMICAGTELDYFGERFNAARTTGDVVVPTPSANGCDSTVTVNLSFFAPATGTLDTMICAGTELDYFGERFNAARPTGDVNVPTPSANGCDSTVTVSLTFFAPAFSALDTTICAGQRLDFFGEIFDADRLSGDVVVPTPAANGCDSTVTINLGFYPQPAGTLDTTICAGETFSFTGRDFSAATQNELVILAGEAAFGCDSLVSVTVNVIESSSLLITGNSVVCDGGNLEFSIQNTSDLAVGVRLTTNPTMVETLPPNSTTPFSLTATPGTLIDVLSADNGTRCPPVVSGAFTVAESDLNVIIEVKSGDAVFGISCADDDDGALLAVASGGQEPFSYQWNTGAAGAALNGLSAGLYSVVVTGGNGCTTDAQMILNEPDALVTAIAEIPADCRDTLPRLLIRDVQGGVGPYVYRTATDAPFVPFAALPDTLTAAVGRNDFALEDANGCRLEQSFDLAGPPATSLEISPGRSVITQGDSIGLRLVTDLDVNSFRVTPGPDTEVSGRSIFVAPLETTTYSFSVVDPGGCSATAEATVFIDDFVPVYAPSAFSPNGDGTNDVFRIFAKPVVASFSNFAVFDRWGEQVFREPMITPDRMDQWGWNGDNAAGQPHQSGVYIYSVDVNLRDGRVITLKGDFVLMR